MPRRIALTLLVLIISASFAIAQIRASRVRVSGGFAQSLLLKRVNPVYPPLARQARIQGTVVLQVQISKSGDVEKLELVSGHPMLAPAAIEAVKQWKYQTYLLNGEPVAVETTVTVNFTLSDNPPTEGIVGSAPPQGIAGAADSGTPLPPPPQRVRVSSGVMQALLITKVNPQYPSDARVQGTVLLKVNIDKEGNVANIQVISGHPLLIPAAIEAVKQWKYKPYLLNNEPIAVETQVQVNFTLLGK
jgi:TonB family protein